MPETNRSSREEILEQEKVEGHRQNMLMVKIGLTVFVTFVCCILFFFILYRYRGVASIFKKLIKAAQPIIIGIGLAYLLNPVIL